MHFAPSFDDLTARLREFMNSSSRGAATSQALNFDAIALNLFALQFGHNTTYRRICEAQHATPSSVRHWTEIPAVPAAASKELDLSCLPRTDRTTVFYSSGTTGQQPSRHFHNVQSLALYESSLLSWFFTAAFPGGRPPQVHRDALLSEDAGWRLAILTPSPFEAPHSSLVHMFGTLRLAFGEGSSVFLARTGQDGRWNLDFQAVVAFLKECARGKDRALLLGTAFSYVHLLDYLLAQRHQFTLPPGSLVMETGGYKGLSRSLPRMELHSLLSERLSIEPAQIICEYGMSELSSQAYDCPTSLGSPRTPGSAGEHTFRFPPWARVQVVSPETRREVNEGETGLLRIFDLANVYSVMAIQTEDLGIRRAEGFEFLGRAVTAEPRGCSLMVA